MRLSRSAATPSRSPSRCPVGTAELSFLVAAGSRRRDFPPTRLKTTTGEFHVLPASLRITSARFPVRSRHRGVICPVRAFRARTPSGISGRTAHPPGTKANISPAVSAWRDRFVLPSCRGRGACAAPGWASRAQDRRSQNLLVARAITLLRSRGGRLRESGPAHMA